MNIKFNEPVVIDIGRDRNIGRAKYWRFDLEGCQANNDIDIQQVSENKFLIDVRAYENIKISTIKYGDYFNSVCIRASKKDNNGKKAFSFYLSATDILCNKINCEITE